MSSIRYFSANIITINKRPLTTLITRTYLLRNSSLISSYFRSFQTSIKNNNEDNINSNNNNSSSSSSDSINDNNNKNNEDNNIKDNENKKVDLLDKILSNNVNYKENDAKLSGKELFSILEESLSRSRSVPISGENSQSISIKTSSSPSLSSPSLSSNDSEKPKTPIFDSISLFDSTTSKLPLTKKSISMLDTTIISSVKKDASVDKDSTLDPTFETTNVSSTKEDDASTKWTIDKNDPRFVKEDPVISQLVNIIMRHGKKATARRFLADAMAEIRRQTHNDPYSITKAAIEKVSPLVSHMSYKKGSKVTLIPKALSERQRRHKGIRWILDASDKRSGKCFSIRLANEILAVINGDSAALKKKEQLHKLALANRANLPVKW
jgi:ribosomal protein S7